MVTVLNGREGGQERGGEEGGQESIEEKRGDKGGEEGWKEGRKEGNYRKLLVYVSIMVIISNIYVCQDITPHILSKYIFVSYTSINIGEGLSNELFKVLLKARTIEQLP